MRHIIHKESPKNKYDIALLIKETALQKTEIERYYINKITSDSIISFSLSYPDTKVTVKHAKAYLQSLLKGLNSLEVKTLLVADAQYYKILTGVRKNAGCQGYIKPCVIAGYEHMKVILSVNYQAIFHNPSSEIDLDLSVKVLNDLCKGTYQKPGLGIITHQEYPETLEDIQEALNKLHKYDLITCDIEAYSLDFDKADIGTISFAWNQNEGIAFCIDKALDQNVKYSNYSFAVRKMLRNFFMSYTGTVMYHNGSYDIKVLIYELFMTGLQDLTGMLKGLDIMFRHVHDTKLIAYLALNSATGNTLNLKHLAHPYAGNYAEEDIDDISLIPIPELLLYNLTDAVSTFWLYNQYYQQMIDDNQLDIYNSILLPSLKVICQMELTGMPMDMDAVQHAETELFIKKDAAENILEKSQIIIDFEYLMRKTAVVEKNLLLKKKRVSYTDFLDLMFNPGSNVQVANLFFDVLGYEVIDKTPKGHPAVGVKTLKKLRFRMTDPAHIEVLDAIIEISKANKILSTFIKAFKENVILKDDGYYYLHGNFNLGVVISGRLSSSGPNLQNMPSGSTYGKLIKACFRAPKGWLMVSADFAALEAMIGALLTQDPNKLKIYIDGYDGHSVNAFAYWPEKMPDIVDTVKSINTIGDKYPKVRRESKTVTFAAQYGGTWHTFMNNCGFSKAEAIKIEENYKKLYKVSIEWVEKKLKEAATTGYVTCAFGLRLRTPILAKTIANKRSTPYEAQSEARSAGNAMQQSYGMLNNRSAIEFQKRTLASKYATSVLPIAHIHDAQYFLVRNDAKCVKWVNDNLIDCMKWQELPEIQHDIVKIGAELIIHWPTWAKEVKLPNNADLNTIISICKEAAQAA